MVDLPMDKQIKPPRKINIAPENDDGLENN